MAYFAPAKKTPRSGRFFLGDAISFLAALFLVLSWWLPLHFAPWVSWHSEVLAFLAVFFLAWTGVIRSIDTGVQGMVRLPVLVVPLAGLVALAIGQFLTGLVTFGGDALVFVSYMVLCAMGAMLGFSGSHRAMDDIHAGSAKDTNSALPFMAAVVLLGAFASAILAFAQVLELWEQSAWINRMLSLRRPGGNIGQPNQLATLLLMGMASLLFLYESGRLKAASSALIFAVLGVALAMTESRTGVLSFLLLALWWAVRSRPAGFKLSPWAVGLGGMAFMGFFWAWPSIFSVIWQSTGPAAMVDTNPGYRLIVWPQLLEALAQRPWLGWGLNQAPRAHNAVASSYTLSEPYSYSHNILIDLALGLGLPLAALLVVITGVWMWRRIRFARQLQPWYCVALVLPVAVHSMLEFPFTYAYFLVPVMFVLGVLEGLSGTKPAFTMGARPAAALLLVISVVAAWSVVEYIEIEEDFRVARFEALRVGHTPASYERPHIVLLTQLDALLVGARIVPKPGMSPAELDLAEKVALRYPWTATENRYALSLALNGNPQEALRQLRVMRALHGERDYAKIRASWNDLAQKKYPQLRGLTLP